MLMIDLDDIIEAAAYIERANNSRMGGPPQQTHCKNGHDLSVHGKQKWITNAHGVQVKAGRWCNECKRARQRKGTTTKPNAQKPRKPGRNPYADDYIRRDVQHRFEGNRGIAPDLGTAGDRPGDSHVQGMDGQVRLILHKSNFPEDLKGTADYWLRYGGEDFGVVKHFTSSRYVTWEVFHAETFATVREDFEYLDHIRRYAAADIDAFLVDLKADREWGLEGS